MTPWFLIAVLLVLLPDESRALYVSYENPNNYRVGDRVHIAINKLYSSDQLSSIDYSHLNICGTGHPVNSQARWEAGMQALHGDAFYSAPYDIHMLQDDYCHQLCVVNTSRVDFARLVRDGYGLYFQVDSMPTAVAWEDDSTISTSFWGRVALGVPGKSSSDGTMDNNSVRANVSDDPGRHLYVQNHLRFDVYYWPSGSGYRVIRTVVEAFSLLHTQVTRQGTGGPWIPTCNPFQATTYDAVQKQQPQQVNGSVDQILFTYDVRWMQWKPTNHRDPYNTRWDAFLTMDGGSTPVFLKALSVILGVILCGMLLGTLWVWVMRDLSYKPIMEFDQEEMSEDAVREVDLWPLSQRIFFPPQKSPFLLCVACGTGAQLLASGFVFLVFFRTGIINQSLWANLLTPVIVIYTVFSFLGGYVTAALYGILHCQRNRALQACIVTATAFPLMGFLVLHFVYDVFPEASAPQYHVLSKSLPVLLMWLFVAVPLTVVGGYFGHRHGPLTNFPVSAGSAGYQDMDLEDDSGQPKAKKTLPDWCYIPLLLAIGGVLPMLSVFVAYAYGVAGPVFVGYYVDQSSFLVASFTLFNLCAGSVSALLYYRQIRLHNYHWWWASFASAGSSGIYLFILSFAWLTFNVENVSGRIWTLYMMWFAYTSFGVVLMTGFVGVVSCIYFNRALYAFNKRRQT